MTPMEIAEHGFRLWAEKPHNAKWVRRIDGTPIANDLIVNMAEAFKAALASPSQVRVTEEAGWQPIETAPKDWSDVLLHVPDLSSDVRTVCEGYFALDGLFWRSSMFGIIHPTHWRPLPEPPLASLPSGEDEKHG